MPQLQILDISPENELEKIARSTEKLICGGNIVIFYEDGKAVVITTPLVGVFDLTEDGRFSQ
jgi:hypothetical protein